MSERSKFEEVLKSVYSNLGLITGDIIAFENKTYFIDLERAKLVRNFLPDKSVRADESKTDISQEENNDMIEDYGRTR